MTPPIICLTTDFGTSGPYVAAMKGVILGLNPGVHLVDVSHEIGPQNIREAALCLAKVVPHFPPGTIHAVVVDPGVGTERRLLCVRMHEQLFLAPDNGVLSWAARGAATIERIQLAQSRFWRHEVSATFHGRDILAPVAAHLSLGVAPQDLGPALSDWVELPWPAPVRTTQAIEGEVLAIDRFGNVITNIDGSELIAVEPSGMRACCGGQTTTGLVRTYADARVGSLLTLVGSSGLLEIAVRGGSAADRLRADVGFPVLVTW
jgi:hypothetical protein